MLAMVGDGAYKNICEAIQDNVKYMGAIMPDKKHAEILKKLRSSTRSARPILDLSNAESIDLSKVKLDTSAALAKGVVINSKLLSIEDVTTLRAYSLSVFLETDGNTAARRILWEVDL